MVRTARAARGGLICHVVNRGNGRMDAVLIGTLYPGCEVPHGHGGTGDPLRGVDRLMAQGTRSECGRQWCERIWTAIAACSGRGNFSGHGQFGRISA